MKTDQPIKRLEYRLFLIITVLAFVFSIFGLVVYLDKDQKERDAYYQQQSVNSEKISISFAGPYCFPDNHPRFLLLTILLVGLLFLTAFFEFYFLSILFLFILISRFIYWYFDTQKLLQSNETAIVKGVNSFLYKANDFDLATLSILTFLCVWQLSILFRKSDKKLFKKDIMP